MIQSKAKTQMTRNTKVKHSQTHGVQFYSSTNASPLKRVGDAAGEMRARRGNSNRTTPHVVEHFWVLFR